MRMQHVLQFCAAKNEFCINVAKMHSWKCKKEKCHALATFIERGQKAAFERASIENIIIIVTLTKIGFVILILYVNFLFV